MVGRTYRLADVVERIEAAGFRPVNATVLDLSPDIRARLVKTRVRRRWWLFGPWVVTWTFRVNKDAVEAAGSRQ
jgi:NifB/MoaA-like Fe-S oxidoreductase